jgi:hemoglobin/transferrin/lactoferrin receptor protein
MTRKFLCLLCIAALAAPALLYAQGADEPADPTAETDQPPADAATDQEAQEEAVTSFFATTTVTATGREVDAFEITTPVTVITAREIERLQPQNAADLLRAQPGVDVNGVGPNQPRPIIRGQRGLRIVFLENGLRLNNARRQTDFGEVTGLVDIDSVQTMEVVRGPASVLYGSDAIGGVLNLITKQPGHRDGRAVGGSFGWRYASAPEQNKLQASVDGRSQKLSFNLGATYRDGDDYDAAAGSFGDITLEEDTPVIDTGLEDDSFWGYFGYRLSEKHLFSLRLNRYRADQTGFGFVDPVLLGAGDDFRIRILYPFQDFDRYTLGYFGSALETKALDSIDAQVYFQSNERQLANDILINIGPIFPGAPDSSVEIDTVNFTDLDTVGARIEAIKVLGGERHVLTYGAEYFEDDSFNTDSSATTTTLRFPGPPFEVVDVQTDDLANAPNATNRSFGIFVQDEVVAGERLSLTLGARYTNVKTKAEFTPGWDTSNLDFSDDSVVGAVNLLYRVTDNLHLVGSLASAFRAPNIIERLFNGPTPEGSGFQILNPFLTSEESTSFDIGLKYRRRNAFFEAVYFDNNIEDGIIQDFLSREEIDALPQELQDEIEASGAVFVVQQRNIDQLTFDGLEVALGYRAGYGLSVGGNYTHITSERTGQSAAPVENHFSDKFNAYVRYDRPGGRFWVEYRLRHNGDEDARIDPEEPLPAIGDTLPSFTIHTLSGGVVLFERGAQVHSLTVAAQNFSDELYAEFSNATFFRPEPRRNLVVAYHLRF